MITRIELQLRRRVKVRRVVELGDMHDIMDRFDPATGMSAMMRTTAFPASIIAQMMARGETSGRGALPQELCVPPAPFVAALRARGIELQETLHV